MEVHALPRIQGEGCGVTQRRLWAYRNRQRQAMLVPRVSQRTDFSLPDCRCSVPPWLPCEHTWEPPELEPEQVEHLRSIRYDAG